MHFHARLCIAVHFPSSNRTHHSAEICFQFQLFSGRLRKLLGFTPVRAELVTPTQRISNMVKYFRLQDVVQDSYRWLFHHNGFKYKFDFILDMTLSGRMLHQYFPLWNYKRQHHCLNRKQSGNTQVQKQYHSIT